MADAAVLNHAEEVDISVDLARGTLVLTSAADQHESMMDDAVEWRILVTTAIATKGPE